MAKALSRDGDRLYRPREGKTLVFLEGLFRNEGIRAATLRANVPTHKREAWYRERLRRGIDVAICHPKIVETGLDLLDFPTILFHETGYSLHTLRQYAKASRPANCRSSEKPTESSGSTRDGKEQHLERRAAPLPQRKRPYPA